MPNEPKPDAKWKRVVDRSGAEEAQRQEIGHRVAHLRNRLEVSRRGLSDLYGVDHTTMRDWENGVTYPPLMYVLWVWQQYQVPPEWLLLGDDRRCPKWLVENLVEVRPGKRVAPPAGVLQSADVEPGK